MLGSYSSEHSPIADDVLKGAGRITEVALMRGDFKQSIRNHITSFIFGLSPVKKKLADVLTEVSIGYPKSPLNGGGEYPGGGPGKGNALRLTLIIRASELEIRHGLLCMQMKAMAEGLR